MPNSPAPGAARLSEQVTAAIHAFLRLRPGGLSTAAERRELARLQRLYLEALQAEDVRAEDIVRAA